MKKLYSENKDYILNMFLVFGTNAFLYFIVKQFIHIFLHIYLYVYYVCIYVLGKILVNTQHVLHNYIFIVCMKRTEAVNIEYRIE